MPYQEDIVMQYLLVDAPTACACVIVGFFDQPIVAHNFMKLFKSSSIDARVR